MNLKAAWDLAHPTSPSSGEVWDRDLWDSQLESALAETVCALIHETASILDSEWGGDTFRAEGITSHKGFLPITPQCYHKDSS